MNPGNPGKSPGQVIWKADSVNLETPGFWFHTLLSWIIIARVIFEVERLLTYSLFNLCINGASQCT